MKFKVFALILLIMAISASLISCDFGGGDLDGDIDDVIEGDNSGDIGGGDVSVGPGNDNSSYYCPDGNHDLTDWYTEISAKCEKAGKKQRSCYNCPYFEEKEIPKLGHELITEITEPTCNTDGEELIYCTRCSYESSTVLSKGHVFSNWYESLAPTCTDKGEEKRDCTREACLFYEVRDGADALDHKLSDWETTSPTCEEDGKMTRECTREGCKYSENNTLPSHSGHNLCDWYESKAPTCKNAGEKKRECTREECDYYETQTGDNALGHDMGEWKVTEEPTCIHNGLSRSDCDRDGCYYYETKDLFAHGHHSYGDWVETKAPTCTAQGSKKRECQTKGCYSYENGWIDIIDHSEIHHEGQDSTCREFGWNEYVTCENCSYTTFARIGMKHSFTGGFCTECGEREPSTGLVYTISDDGEYYILTGATNQTYSATELVVASVYNGLPVKEIRQFFVIYNDTVTSVTIPDRITTMGYEAFSYFRAIERVYISDLVAWCTMNFVNSNSNPLRNGASLYLNGEELTDLVVPDTVSSISPYAFYKASSIRRLITHDSLYEIGTMAFYKCPDLTEVTLGKNVLRVSQDAFEKCNAINTVNYHAIGLQDQHALFSKMDDVSSLIKLVVGKDVVSIPDNLFASSKISEIIFEENSCCYAIGKLAFAHCNYLFSVTIPSSVRSIEEDTFYECRRLVQVYNLSPFNRTNDFFGAQPYIINTSANAINRLDNIDGHVYYVDYSSENKITYLGFIGLGNTLTLPESYYGYTYKFHPYALTYVKNIEVLVVPDSFESLTEGIFKYFTSLKEITLPFVGESKSATNYRSHFGYIFGYDPFEYEIKEAHYYDTYTDSYYKYNIPSSLNRVTINGSIPKNSFRNCTSITTITIGEDATSIGAAAFSGCTWLSKIYINSKQLSSIYVDSFTNAGSELSPMTLYIGNEVTTIPEYLFYDAKYLTTIDFSKASSLTFIGTCAFYGTSVQKLEIPGGVTIGTGAFQDCKKLYTVQTGSYKFGDTVIGTRAFMGCESLKKVTIYDNVNKIGIAAFVDCDNLNEVVFYIESGWELHTSQGYNKTISESDLHDSSKAAELLREKYSNYYWIR